MMIKKFLSVSDHILDHSVYDTVREPMGKIKDVFIDPETHHPVFVVLATGGFLGIGSDHIALPWHTLEFNTNSHEITLKMNRHELKNAPELDINKLKDADREETEKMYRFYGEAEFEKVKGSAQDNKEAEPSDPHPHEAYEGSADITDEVPDTQPGEAAKNMDYEKTKGLK